MVRLGAAPSNRFGVALGSLPFLVAVNGCAASATASMSVIRFHPAATLLDDGTVLVTGGDGAGVVVERYQPGSGS